MFYYTRNGQQFGPHSADELRGLITSGTLTAADLVWREGMPGWAPAHTVFPSVPPPPPSPAPAPGAAWSGPVPGHGHAAYPYPYPYPATGKSRLSYVLLGVFLGGLGIHNFYAGYTGRGVTQLVLTVFLWWLVVPLFVVAVWALVEVVTVTEDAQGVRFT